jgi:hypothetical protein
MLHFEIRNISDSTDRNEMMHEGPTIGLGEPGVAALLSTRRSTGSARKISLDCVHGWLARCRWD